MCGIAGVVGLAASQDKVRRMVTALRRRGPDDEGIWSDSSKRVVMGHARLSIIDLSSAGHQPMTLMNDQYTIVFNGEIYNYKELKKELELEGAQFRTHSDTEVILWAWFLWGKEALPRFRGMYAFAIWEREKAVLTLVRDRMGIKPLLWYQNVDGIVFASSLKAILSSDIVPRVLNRNGLFDYLIQGAVLQPRTMIKNVWALEPGTMKVFRLGRDGAVSEISNERYWELRQDKDLARNLATMPYVEQVRLTRQKLEEACQYHLIADVPVGSFLSGGVDSTAITALMTRLSGERIKSFSIGFSKETGMQDELSEARIAAQHIGTEHTEVILTGKEVAEHFDDFVEALDQPSVDGLNTYWVSKVTREHGVKVALSGLGGDELFAGYDHFRWAEEVKRMEKVGWKDYLSSFFYRRLPYSRMPPRGCRKLMSMNEQLATLRRFMTVSQVKAKMQASFGTAFDESYMGQYIQALNITDGNPMVQMTQYECRNYLLNTLLRDADSLSMGYGLEVRPIFLDSCLVEHAMSLPEESKWRNGIAKAILKDTASDLLPPDFFRRKKTGFTLPTNYWLEHELRHRFLELLRGRTAQVLFSKGFLRDLSLNNLNRWNRQFKWQIFVLLQWIDSEEIVIP